MANDACWRIKENARSKDWLRVKNSPPVIAGGVFSFAEFFNFTPPISSW
jgi:hypothetical protein